MKKISSTSKHILFYLETYFLAQSLCGVIMVFILCIVKGKDFLEDGQVLIRENAYIIALIASFLSIIIYNYVFKNRKKSLKDRLILKRIDFKCSLRIIACSIGSAMFLGSVVFSIQHKFPSYIKTTETIDSAQASVLAMVSIVIILPIFEEILFRGLVFDELRKSKKFKRALIIQAVLFGIMHGNSLQGLYAFALGITYGLIYAWTKSLYGSMLAHIVFNLLGSSIFPMILDKTKNFVYGYMVFGLLISIVSMMCIYKQSNNENKALDVGV
ncbi:CPBP family intramembrane glutamic endopeptidase [Hathewaya histolytica]|uniref:CAAX amino protease family protein n=1 Tax=Hathewaya histolytica TaxID=1498 RepID=A0A4U9QUN9_HATHI|nr:CPBP family intramembrane glutamic endopeptidase [Hathewaya histolytica]VTQ82212.1 CAAX amino protease family protein [Hathewaya histolytica]